MDFFIENKYTRWYFSIIKNAKKLNRKKGLGIYYDNHHIIPKCDPFNGSNKKDNLVLLTAREHFLCHWLLTKMCEGEKKWKMQYALTRMLGSKNKMGKNLFSKKHFEIAKKHQIEAYYKRCEIEGFPMEGKTHSDEAKQKMRLAKLGVKRDPTKIGYLKERKHTKETKNKISEGLKNRPVSDETKKKLSRSNIGKLQNKTIMVCNVCGNKNYATQIKRYHNDNCKNRG